ncbi:hypothetical protein DT594_08615 [Halopseudomonas laoshanensis]|uniref:Uncharacterized protein n=1 Tax=Halopseudomonas laoshanensis TaxID=2268758 RepID=A0A7V7GWA1_9GAMM|nr:hypothetical protein [Halopseudomonas laoshanensis]KAA0694926.1 hypothetical protein DT594_08615 [Halopseudomonas laoshanensis]
MTEAVTTLNTNRVRDSVQDVTLECRELWSVGQQEAIRRLSEEHSPWYSRSTKRRLIPDFSARAARIAASYARFYLEIEEGGMPEHKGRFYWMGLAAFASKQVKCALDFIPEDPLFHLSVVPGASVSKNALGQGNFWLFQDIFVWHWFYARFPEQFAYCSPKRDASDAVDPVNTNMTALPWAAESLSTLNNLRLTNEITQAFNDIRAFEVTTDMESKRVLQLSSLMVIANHEQLNILQPLIYENWAFKRSLDMQSLIEGVPLVPKRVASFTTTCDTDNGERRVQMREGNLYEEADRMDFIASIAERYHLLMQRQKRYMEEVISSIAAWGSVR